VRAADDAFHRYQSLLRPYIENKQRAAKSFFRSVFAPRTSLRLVIRNLVIAATTIPGLARLAFGRDLVAVAHRIRIHPVADVLPAPLESSLSRKQTSSAIYKTRPRRR
jgi:hypothetical protein